METQVDERERLPNRFIPVKHGRSEEIFTYIPQSKLKLFLYQEFGFPWGYFEYLELSGYLLVLLIQESVMISLLTTQEVDQNDEKREIALTLIVGFAVLFLFGIFFMKFRLTTLRYLVIFVLGILVPFTVLLLFLYELEQQNPVVIGGISLVMGGVGFQISLRWLRQQLFEVIGKIKGSVVCFGINVLIWGLITTGTFYIALTDESYDSSFNESISLIIFIPYLIFLVNIWYFIHQQYFKQFSSEVQILRGRLIKNNQSDIELQVMMKKYPNMLDETNEGCWLVFSEYKNIFASIILISTLILCKIGLFVVYFEYLEDQHQTNVASLVFFYFIAAPVFLFGGIVFTASTLKKDDKFCTAIFLFILLGGVLQPVGYMLFNIEQTETLGLVLMIGYPLSVFYWVSMSMLFHHYKRQYQLVSTLSCLTIIIPIGFILPFYTIEAMKETTFWVFIAILGIGGVLLILMFWLIDFLKKFRAEMFVLLRGLKNLNFYDIVQYLYTIRFILSFTILIYIYVSNFDDDSWASGLVGGSIAILIFSIFSTIIIHRVTLYVKDPKEEQVTIQNLIKGEVPEPTIFQQKLLRKKTKYQKGIAVTGMIFPLILLVILVSTFSGAQNILSLVSTIVVGFVIVSLVVLILIEMKSFLRQFGEDLVTYSLGGCWFMCLIPMFVLIPITLSFADEENQQTLHTISAWTIGVFFFLCLGSVGTASILINSFFKKMRQEKIAKYCLQKLIRKLSRLGVRSNFSILWIIFDQFYLNGKDIVNGVLKEKTILSYIDIPEDDPDLGHSKEIKTLKQANKLNKKRKDKKVQLQSSQQEDKEKSQEEGCLNFLKKCFSSSNEIPLPNEEDPFNYQISILTLQAYVDNHLQSEQANIQEYQQKPKQSLIFQTNPNNHFQSDQFQEYQLMPKKSLILQTNPNNHFQSDQLQEYQQTPKQQQKQIILNIQINKIEQQDLQAPSQENQQMKAKVVTEQIRKELLQEEHFHILKNDYIERKNWYKIVFQRFSHGFHTQTKQSYMTSQDLRQFIRLSGLSKNISNASCDILYTKMTKKYDKTSNQIYHSTIQFKNFENELLPKVSKSVFPKQPLLDAQQSLFQDFIFINLVTNFPYLKKKTKVVVIESDPVSFIQSIVIQEIQKQDIQEVQKQDIQEIQKQDIQEVQKQDFKEVQKQDIKEVQKQDIKEILEQIIKGVQASLPFIKNRY